jgi:hypothetical protein
VPQSFILWGICRLFFITGNDQEGIKDLFNHFHKKDLGRLHYVLWIEAAQSQG